MEFVNRKNDSVISSFSSFLFGLGSVLDIHGSYFFVSFKGRSDTEKIKDDWQKIGADMRVLLKSKSQYLSE